MVARGSVCNNSYTTIYALSGCFAGDSDEARESNAGELWEVEAAMVPGDDPVELAISEEAEVEATEGEGVGSGEIEAGTVDTEGVLETDGLGIEARVCARVIGPGGGKPSYKAK